MYFRISPLKILQIFLLFAASVTTNAQVGSIYRHFWSFDEQLGYNISFDPDTLSQYSWKVGVPNKAYFNSAHSMPNAISTELDSSYYVNDTITFTISHAVREGLAPEEDAQYAPVCFLAGFYKVDCDSLNDYGKIEVTPDGGITWIDIINGSIAEEYFIWNTPQPLLTGRSDWTLFIVEITRLGDLYSFHEGDTASVKMRFSFISDSIENYRDGLMFDEIELADYGTGVELSTYSAKRSRLYPNPVNDFVVISVIDTETSDWNLVIQDLYGRQVYSEEIRYENNFRFNTTSFKSGFYTYLIFKGKKQLFSTGKFIVQH